MVSMKELSIFLMSDESRGLVGFQGMAVDMTDDWGGRGENGEANQWRTDLKILSGQGRG